MRNTDSNLRPRELTWAALLARWLEFARASVVLPDDDEGRRWRRSVAPIINLQAVYMALGELAELPRTERELGVDKADIIIRDACCELNRVWRSIELPQALAEITGDARKALRRATSLADVLVCQEEAIAPNWNGAIAALIEEGFAGTLFAARSGARLAPGAPLAWVQRGDPQALYDTVKDQLPNAVIVTGRACQVMRLADDLGQPVEDVAVELDAEPVAGLPLLIPAIVRGERCRPGQHESFGEVAEEVLRARVPFRIAFETA